MEPLKIGEILTFTEGELLQGNPEKWVKGISTDSRNITKGDLFVALKGDKFDGHNFIEEVIKERAEGIIVAQDFVSHIPYPPTFTVIKVKDTLLSLGKIAAKYREKFQIPIIGITGSNGKTTVKEIAYTLISKKFNTLKAKGSFNNAVGLPLTLLEINYSTQAVVTEIGMNQEGEIKYLSQIAKPTVGLITNIGEAHIGYLNKRANIAKEKAQLLEVVAQQNGIGILNQDDYYLKRTEYQGEKVTFGIYHQADIRASDITQDINGITFKISFSHRPQQSSLITVPILGFHNVYNVLAATAMACGIGVDWELIKEGYQEIKAFDGRMQLLSSLTAGVKIINDTYNANPTSVKAALETLSQFQTKGRKIFVMGDMLELGKFSSFYHQSIIKKVMETGVNILFTIGKETNLAVKSINGQKVEVYRCDTNEEIIAKLKNILLPQDIILIKGSRKMKLDEVVVGLLKE